MIMMIMMGFLFNVFSQVKHKQTKCMAFWLIKFLFYFIFQLQFRLFQKKKQKSFLFFTQSDHQIWIEFFLILMSDFLKSLFVCLYLSSFSLVFFFWFWLFHLPIISWPYHHHRQIIIFFFIHLTFDTLKFVFFSLYHNNHIFFLFVCLYTLCVFAKNKIKLQKRKKSTKYKVFFYLPEKKQKQKRNDQCKDTQTWCIYFFFSSSSSSYSYYIGSLSDFTFYNTHTRRKSLFSHL